MEATPRRFPGLRLLAGSIWDLVLLGRSGKSMHLITSPLRRPGTTQGAACQPLGAALPARIGLSSCRRPPRAAPAPRHRLRPLPGPGGALGGRAARLWVCCAPGTPVPGLGHGWLRGAPRGGCSRGRPGSGLLASAALLPPCPRSGWRGRKRRCLRSPEPQGLPGMCEVKGGGWMVVGSWVVPCPFGELLFPNASLLPGVAEWEGK